MKTLLLLSLLYLPLSCFAQDTASFRVVGWHYEYGNTRVQIQFNQAWCVFALLGNHVGDTETMIREGCLLSKRWALYNFDPIRGLRYVGKGDENAIKETLGIDKICNK